MDQVGDRLAVGELADSRSRVGHAQASIDRSVGSGVVSVPAEEVGDRVLREAEAVVHPEPIRSGALRLVEGDLLGDAREQCPQAVRDRSPGSMTLPPWELASELPGGSGHAETAR